MAEQDTTTAQAAAQTDQASGQANGEGEGTQTTQDKAKPFTPEQEQYMGSWMGRIIKKQFEENVIPLLNRTQQHQAPVEQDKAVKDLNEQLNEAIFSGKPFEAINKALEIRDAAQKNVSEIKSQNLLKGMVTYSDKPYYEDIQPEMQKLAREKVAQGWPVGAALEASYAEAKAAHLESKLTDDGDREHQNLNLTGGGRQPHKKNKTITLPPAYAAAAARDIKDGYYKNEAEWIKAQTPKVREALGV